MGVLEYSSTVVRKTPTALPHVHSNRKHTNARTTHGIPFSELVGCATIDRGGRQSRAIFCRRGRSATAALMHPHTALSYVGVPRGYANGARSQKVCVYDKFSTQKFTSPALSKFRERFRKRVRDFALS